MMNIGLLPCAGTATRLYNIPKFLLPLKDKQMSLLTNWCHILLNAGCEKIIIGSSVSNKPFIDHLISNQLSDVNERIFIKIVENSPTMNNTIIEMLKNETYNIAVMAMPDTHVDYISQSLIEKLSTNDKHVVGAFLWNIRSTQAGKIGQCEIDGNFICNIIDKDKGCNYKYGWGCIVFKPSFETYIQKSDLHMGFAMASAIPNGVLYENMRGQYWDCGTVDEYREYLNFMKIIKPIHIKGCLIIVSVYIGTEHSKYECLVNCLRQLREIYKYETIVSVDNMSLNHQWYDVAKELDIHIIRNESNMYRYEIGAYNLALKYFRADTYICIQGTIFFHSKISNILSENNADIFAFKVLMNNLHWHDYGLKIINEYLSFANMSHWNNDPLLLWNCFYCNDLFMQKLLSSGLLDMHCNSKDCSCAYERILGCFVNRTMNDIKMLDNSIFTKHFLNQM
jgi:hypothetical protein